MTNASVVNEQLAYIIYRMAEGDDVLEFAFDLLAELGYIDSDGEWIYDDDNN